MNNLKTNIKLLVKGVLIVAFIAFGFIGCDNEELQLGQSQSEDVNRADGNKKGMIDICHYDMDYDRWMVLTVNENSWEGHSGHGDFWLDRDGDGFTAYNECGFGSMDDCNDEDATIYPGAEDACGDEIDQNCDGIDGNIENAQYFYLWVDADEDGWSELVNFVYVDSDCRPEGYLTEAESYELIYFFDCDDSNPAVYPGAPEICDDIDNSCNGTILDRYATVTVDGQDYPVGAALFGPLGTVTAPWTTIGSLACEPVPEELTGKIVFIDRGDCYFEWKVYHAQINGAVGVVICSSNGVINMSGPGDYEITIPSILITSDGCSYLQQYPEVSFSVFEDCIDPSNRIGRTDSDKFNKTERINTHSIDSKSGEFVQINIQE